MPDSLPLLPLRDIHIPDSVSLWPPAPGWWLLGGLVLSVILALSIRRYRRGALKRAALGELARIRQAFEANPDYQRLPLELSMLLRRLALARFPREQVAGLNGRDWLEFLDRHGGNGAFCQGDGKVLAVAPYANSVDVDGEKLLLVATAWVRTNT